MTTTGRIRAGIGGWTFEPWRGVFYPKGLKQAGELDYASRHLTAIEVNGTYYSTFKPDSFAKWRAATPEGFRFSIKASRFCTNRKVLADMGQSMEVFLKLLPDSLGGLPLRHVVEPRHASFQTPEFVALARRHKVAIAVADHASYPMIADPTGAITRNFDVMIEEEGLALRGTFVVNPEGQIKIMEVHDNGIGRDAKELLRKVQAAQYVASHPGEVCPASWTPGAETLAPSLDLVGKI